MSLEILVSLRTAASAEAPLSPIALHPILQSMGEVGGGERVGVSMGADTKANAQELVREAGGLLERLQRGVALEALGESESSLRAEVVGRDTVSTGEEAGAGHVKEALTRKQTLYRWAGGAPDRPDTLVP